MTTTRNHRSSPSRSSRWHAVAAAFAMTLLGGNAQAVTFPAVPLQTSAEFPPPNVQFILDDSGSMASIAMPADASDGDLKDTIFDKSYIHNTLYYNPATTYKGWLQANGSRDLSGTSYVRAWNDTAFLSSTIDLSKQDQIYFVPNNLSPPEGYNFSDQSNYFRYAFLKGAEVQLQKSEFSGISTFSGYPKSGLSAAQGKMLAVGTFTVPAGISEITVSSSGTSIGKCKKGDADLYLRLAAAPTTEIFDAQSAGNTSTESVTISNPADGTWHIGLFAYTCFNNITVTATTVNWKQVSLTPATAAELTNYATWYSYHRSRMKTAKAGASEAFGGLTENSRVGFDTINRNNTDDLLGIPVNSNNGLFSNANNSNNKTNWYAKLFAAKPGGFTPLRRALQRAGKSLLDISSSGPWGPGEGATRQVSCRQNFAILTTDGFWNTDAFGSTFETEYESIGNPDNVAGPTHTPEGLTPIKFNNKEYTGYVVERPYMDNFSGSPSTASDTLADVAMQYWKTDLRTDMKNNVPPSNADPAFWQHMVTFGVSIGLQGTLDPSKDLPAIKGASANWPNPFVNKGTGRIDDLWHASVNGRGQFVVASNSESFRKGLQSAFEAIAQKQGTGTGLAANSTTFIEQTRLFQASFSTKTWAGELVAKSVTKAGVGDEQWKASTGIPAAASRTVLTWNGTGGATFPTPAQTSALDQSTRALSPVSGANNADYVKGVQSLEGDEPGHGLRVRSGLLGDIVNSSPIFVKNIDTLFVGANDGMLHAVNASDGKERFAYVPGGIDLPALASLSDPFYSHKFFVDGQLTVSTEHQTPGKTILVGALGRGGKGVFALDVTTPASMTADKVLWELSSDSKLGNVIGEPLIAKLNDSNKTPVVIFGNGPNSGGTNNAVLYVVNLLTGAVLHTLDTGVGGDNALISPRLANTDLDADGTVDAVYAGDLKGNIWKFDFSKAQFTASSAPKIALDSKPLFTTETGQVVTGGLALARDSKTKLWVFFGTGSFMTTDDLNNKTVQSIYGLRDDAITTTLPRSDLQERTIIAVATDQSQRAFTAHDTLPADKKGWYIDLGKPLPGERVVSRPTVREGNVLVFVSIVPQTNNACEASGTGFINALDAFTGTTPNDGFFIGSDGKALTVVNGDGTATSGTVSTGGLPGNGDVVFIDNKYHVGINTPGGGAGTIEGEIKPPPAARIRASWREIIKN